MKKAICVGINYVGTEHELRGCINDADDWASLLSRGGFATSVIAEAQATKKGLVSALTLLVADLRSGDTGAFTYSGHGTWVPDQDGDEPDGRDEAICPYDMGEDGTNLLIDDELHAVFNGLAAGAKLLFVTDCCFSGSVYRFLAADSDDQRRVRFVPPSHHLKDPALVARMNMGFGQPQSSKAQAPLPGVIHFSGCNDNEFSADANIKGRFSGAFTNFAVPAFAAAAKSGGTYQSAWAQVRRSLPSWSFQQTPLLNATPALKKAKVFA